MPPQPHTLTLSPSIRHLIIAHSLDLTFLQHESRHNLNDAYRVSLLEHSIAIARTPNPFQAEQQFDKRFRAWINEKAGKQCAQLMRIARASKMLMADVWKVLEGVLEGVWASEMDGMIELAELRWEVEGWMRRFPMRRKLTRGEV